MQNTANASYAVLRNGFWLTTLLSGAFVLLWPVAPPRLTPGAGGVDTIVAVSGWSNPTVGPYDSCPSLHFSWSLIVCFGTFAVQIIFITRLVFEGWV